MANDSNENKIVVLFLSADPKGSQAKLNVIEECNEVRDTIRSAEYGRQYSVQQEHQASKESLQKYLLETNPQVVHFAGHGDDEEEGGVLLFQDAKGKKQKASGEDIAELFRILNERYLPDEKKIKCVVLNACLTSDVASAISKYVDCVVGMSNKIRDSAARVFAKSFYFSLASGESVKTSFDLASEKLLGIPTEHMIPELISHEGINPRLIYFPNQAQRDPSTKRSQPEIHREISKYIKFVMEKADDTSEVLGKIIGRLNQYYVEQDGIFIADNGNNLWANEDKDFIDNKLGKRDKIKKIIDDKLLPLSGQYFYLAVGGSFGVGTSTLARWLAYQYAFAYSENNLDGNGQVSTEHKENELNCIPIVLSLRKGVVINKNKEEEPELGGEIYNQKRLSDLLKEIIEPSLKLRPAKVLLILDGIEQLDEVERKQLKEIIYRMREVNEDLRVLLLSKPMTFPDNDSEFFSSFIRLLPFDESQAKEFFRKVAGLQGLDYDELKYKFRELVYKPLFATMISQIHTSYPSGDADTNSQTIQLRDERSNWKNIALVYTYFLGQISKKLFGHISKENDKRRKWFRRLRAIAAFFHIHKDNKEKKIYFNEIFNMLTEEGLYQKQDPQDNNVEDDLKPIILKEEKSGSVKFVHESFGQYLLATFYLESLLSYSKDENKIVEDDLNPGRSDSSDIHNVNITRKYLYQYNLNIGIPEKSEPIDFLEGLLEMLLDKDLVHKHNIDLRDCLGYDSNSPPSSDEIRYRLKENTTDILNFPYRVILVLKDALDHNRWVSRWYADERDNIKNNRTNKPFKFGNLWTHLWISLFISNKLLYKPPPDESHLNIGEIANLAEIMYVSSNVVPSFLKKLRGINLSKMKLNGINLNGGDLSYAVVQGAELRGADLCESTLVEAKLMDTDLSNAKLCNAFMLEADLSRANLFCADLSGIRLIPKNKKSQEYKGANFSNTILGDANISDAKLNKANLTGADLYRANLSDSDLSECILKETKLAFANLSYAILHDAVIDKANLSYANLSEADLAGVDLSTCFSESKNDNFTNVDLSNAKIYEALPEKLESYKCDPPINKLLVKTFPGEGEEKVPISTYIIACFSKSIQNGKFEFRVSKSKTDDNGLQQITKIDGDPSKSEDGETIVFKPSCPLDYSSRYCVVIEDSKTNNLAKWWFETEEKDPRFDSGMTAMIAKKEIENIKVREDIQNVKVREGIPHDGKLSERTIDSELTTRWSNYGKGSWIKYDLERKRDICAIDIGWFKGDKRIYYFEIKYSDDDKDKKPYQRIDLSLSESSGKTLSPERYTFEKISARYIMIIVNGNSQNNWASITEVAFYECVTPSS